MIETGNNDLACSCEAGDIAIFNEACVGSVTGAELKKHYYNDSPEPLKGVPNRGHALVVDDDKEFRQYVAEALRKGGYEVSEAIDGIEGLARYHERPKGYFNIILSDWSMPRMMGTNMIRRLRILDETQPILMMSTDDMECRQELKQLRLNVKVLYKGFTGDDLIVEVLKIEGRQRELAY